VILAHRADYIPKPSLPHPMTSKRKAASANWGTTHA